MKNKDDLEKNKIFFYKVRKVNLIRVIMESTKGGACQ